MTSSRQLASGSGVLATVAPAARIRITDVFWIPFCLALREPFHTARGLVTHRSGLVVALDTDAGIVGLGEASPHPLLGDAAVRETAASLVRVAPRILGGGAAHVEDGPAAVDTLIGDATHKIPPALRCALDTAACDALARAQGVSLARFLGHPVRASVPVNAVIGAPTARAAAHHAAAAREEGFRCIKLKVGMARTVEEECRRVAGVRRVLGQGIRLRLDANGAWTVETAIRTIRELEAYDLEFIEQPVAPGDLDGMEAVQSAVGIPIAADDDVTSLSSARRIIERGAARILVVKPMVVGGLRTSRAIVSLAADRGYSALITTTIDGAIGRGAALHLAATLPPDGPACGLATEALLAHDFATGLPVVHQGKMTVPDGPGLGLAIEQLCFRHTAHGHADKHGTPTEEA